MSSTERLFLARLRRMPLTAAFGAWLMALQLLLHGMLMLLPAGASTGIICSVRTVPPQPASSAPSSSQAQLPPCCVGGGECCCLPALDAPRHVSPFAGAWPPGAVSLPVVRHAPPPAAAARSWLARAPPLP